MILHFLHLPKTLIAQHLQRKLKTTLLMLKARGLCYKSCTVVYDDKKVKVTIKDEGQLKQMDIGKMLYSKISIHDAAKDSVEDCVQNYQ